MNLALFDLDHTLLPIDSDYEWGQFLARIGAVDPQVQQLKNDEFFRAYNAGTLDIDAFLAFAFGTLKKHPRAQLDAWHAQYMREVVAPALTPQARALVQQHRDAGDLCAVVTATNSFVTRPIVQAFGIDHLIATEPEEIDGRFTGRVQGTPCFKAGKITRTEAWLASLGHTWDDFVVSTFYSDSANDLPLLGKVKVPVAVNPSDTLRAHARAQGWRVLDLFV